MTTIEKSATPTPDRWHAGAWFGTQLGCTLWVLVAAIGTAPSAPGAAGVVLAAFLAANVSGAWLWRRHRLGHRSAGPLMLLACGSAGLVALVAADAIRSPGAARIPVGVYALVLGLPIVLAWMSYVRRDGERQSRVG